MKDANTLMVCQIDDRAWKLGRVEPLGGQTLLGRLMDMAQEEGWSLEAEPMGLIEGGEYDGGYVIALSNRGDRAYFIVQAYALPLLQGYMGPADYRGMVARIRSG